MNLLRSTVGICIEINISKLLRSKIWINNGDHDFYQFVLYENLPMFCCNCSRFGQNKCPPVVPVIVSTGETIIAHTKVVLVDTSASGDIALLNYVKWCVI
ncbi:unnamed protein product [Cuscuta epithymum]|uniref:Uncharacterized protein n=1 Tax=Cuscuta epithymum TaxID=186058 RepID=A0AAV0CSR3_9ASTE|nr:unnamed protein product [Cuscuta epithymum]